jgi:hypothetical protein
MSDGDRGRGRAVRRGHRNSARAEISGVSLPKQRRWRTAKEASASGAFQPGSVPSACQASLGAWAEAERSAMAVVAWQHAVPIETTIPDLGVPCSHRLPLGAHVPAAAVALHGRASAPLIFFRESWSGASGRTSGWTSQNLGMCVVFVCLRLCRVINVLTPCSFFPSQLLAAAEWVVGTTENMHQRER